MLVSNAKTPEQARNDICDLLAQTQRERQRTADRLTGDNRATRASRDRNQLVADELGLLIHTIKGLVFCDYPGAKPRED